jgi:hypothetical protein
VRIATGLRLDQRGDRRALCPVEAEDASEQAADRQEDDHAGEDQQQVDAAHAGS